MVRVPVADRRARRGLRLLVLGYALLSTVLAAGLVAGVMTSPGRSVDRADYLAYHAAAETVLRGDGGCLYDPECQRLTQQALVDPSTSFTRGLPFNNPPSLALLLAPLGVADYAIGFAVFVSLSVGAYLAAVAWAVRTRRAERTVLVLLALTAWPLITAVLRGQVTILVAAALLLAIGLIDRRPAAAGALLGLATVKPTLLPLVAAWWIARRSWLALLSALAVAAALLVAVALLLGIEPLTAYPAYAIGQLTGEEVAGIDPSHMVNWRAVAAWLGGQAGTSVAVAGTLATLGLVVLAMRRAGIGSPHASAAVLTATPLVIPHANEHEAVLGVMAWVILVSQVTPRPRWLVPVGLALHAALWLGVPLWGTAAAQLSFTALLLTLAVVVLLASTQRQVWTAGTNPSGQRGAGGSSTAAGGS